MGHGPTRPCGTMRCGSTASRAWRPPASPCRTGPASTSISCCSPLLGATGRKLEPSVLARARHSVEDRQARVVQPLRVVRRELKLRLAAVGPTLCGPLTATRQQLAEVELALERVELIMLEELADSLPAGPCDREIKPSARSLHSLHRRSSTGRRSASCSLRHFPAMRARKGALRPRRSVTRQLSRVVGNDNPFPLATGLLCH